MNKSAPATDLRPKHEPGLSTASSAPLQEEPGRDADIVDSYRTPLILAVSIAAFCAEAYFLHAYASDQLPLIHFLAAHLGLSVALAIWAYAYRPDGSHQRLAILLPLATLAFGVFGPLGIALVTVAHRIFRQTSVRFADWYLELFPEEKDEAGRTLYNLIIAGRADAHESTSVDSFADVLRTGTLEQKQAVISLLTRRFRPAFAPALQMALRDPNPAVRVQAATAAAEIENSFSKESERLKHDLSERPGDLAALLKLARHYDDYAFCGLLDSQREAEYRSRALELYFTAIGLEPANNEVKAAISRILVREGEYAEAIHYLGERLEGGEVNRSLVLWYAECLFHLRRYDDVRGLMRRFGSLLEPDDTNNTDDRVAEAARLWRGAHLGTLFAQAIKGART